VLGADGAEPDIVVAIIRVVVVAIRREQVVAIIIVPRTTAQDALPL
jgi:hypothetical protein